MSAYRDQYERFAERNAQVLGVSYDDVETLQRFKESLELPFELLSDADHEVAKSLGADGGNYAKRITFVIDQSGKIIEKFEGAAAMDPAPVAKVCPLPAKKK